MPPVNSSEFYYSGSYKVTAEKIYLSGSGGIVFETPLSGSVSGSFTGSFSGSGHITTASYALNSNLLDGLDSSAFALTSSNSFTGSQTISGSILISGSISTVDYIDFTPLSNGSAPSHLEGRIWYDTEQGALSVYNNEADITLQVGQEEYIRVYNHDDVLTISNGTPVRISGSQGDNPLAWPAVSADHTDYQTVFENHIVGIATHDIGPNSVGYVTVNGVVRNVNTTAFAAGDTLYLQTGSAGLRNSPPPFPYDIVQVGFVVRSAANGFIQVFPKEPVHFSDISGLSGSNAPVTGALWIYDPSNKAWYNDNKLPNIIATGSFTGSFTGSLEGTASNATSASYLIPLKSGEVAPGSFDFVNNVYITTVSFNSVYPNSNYSVSVIGADARVFTAESKLPGGFRINTNSNVPLTGNVYWMAIPYNNP